MVEVLSRRPSGQLYVYALVDRVPRRCRPPAAGVGGGSVVAQSIHDLVLIVSPVTSPLARTLRSQAVHDDVVASLMDAEAVVPFPFGTAVVDLQSWVEARARALRAALVAVRGAVEMTVRLLRLDAGAGRLTSHESAAPGHQEMALADDGASEVTESALGELVLHFLRGERRQE